MVEKTESRPGEDNLLLTEIVAVVMLYLPLLAAFKYKTTL